MSEPNRCAECGTPLPAYWPKGLCVECALDGALGMTHGASLVRPGESPAAPTDLPPPPLSAGSSPPAAFGDYDLLEEIARGGMGIVYKALQRNPGRIVAVKTILAGPLAGRDFVQRFRMESAAAAVLQHPNIVAIHEVGVHEGRHYFSMDYVEGRSLAQIVGRQPLPPATAARYVERIAAAIHYAHERGILHRDLKPSNVLIDSNDQPRVTDFGLAKKLDGNSSLTMTGQVLGSPNFMPPEQAGGKQGKVGRPSDVYALGGILYYLLTARAPFQAESLEQVITQVLHTEPVSPRLLNPSIPRDLETITLKCLEKESSRRYPTARELADELGRVLRQEPIRARPLNTLERFWRWCGRKPALASALGFATAALLAGLATTSWQWHRAERHAGFERRERIAGQRQLYLANMNLAQAAWEQNNVTRLRQLLEETATAPGRGFEWYYWQRQMHLEAQTLRGHTTPVLALAYSPDGQRILTGSAGGTAKVWDVASGRELLTLSGHNAPVCSVAFSRDGQRIVTGSWDKTALVWNAANGTRLVTLGGHAAEILSVAFSPDGQRIVTGSQDQTARVWEANNGNELFPLKGHTNGVWAVAFSASGQRIVTGSSDKTAKVWDAADGNELHSLVGHRGTVLSVAFSPDGQSIVTGSDDRDAMLWETATGNPLAILEGHSAPVASVTFSPDGKRIASAGDDQTARVWDAGDGNELLAVKRHGSRISSVAFSPDSRRIVTGGGSVNSGVTGELINIGTGDKTARIWEASSDPQPLTFRGHTDKVVAVAFSGDGRRIVTGSLDQTAKVWEASNGKELFPLVGHNHTVFSVAYSPDGQRIVTGSWDRTARVWDAAKGTVLLTLKGHHAEIWSVAFSPDGPRIVTGSIDRTAKIWDAFTGSERLTIRGHNSWIASAVFSPDGRRIVTGSRDQTARLWDAASGKELLTFKGHGDWVFSVAFSPDGRRIATASGDHTVKVWEAASKEQVARWQEQERTAAAAEQAPANSR